MWVMPSSSWMSSRWRLVSFCGVCTRISDEQVSFAVAVEHGHALVANTQGGSRLRAFGNLQGVIPFERGDADLGAESGLSERDRHHAVQVVAFALEEGMLFDVEDDVEVAGRPAEGAGFAVPGEADASAVFDAGGDLGF